eukprot:6280248-Alexandrium_andersonii.AAC.1
MGARSLGTVSVERRVRARASESLLRASTRTPLNGRSRLHLQRARAQRMHLFGLQERVTQRSRSI